MKDNLLIKCTKRQAYKAEIARLTELVKELDKDIQSVLTEEKTICKPFVIWYKKNQTKHQFNQSKAKSFLTDEELQACDELVTYDYYSIK